MAVSGLAAVRQRLGDGLFGLVAGPNGPAVGARIHRTPGPRWFDEDRPIRLVHADASMFIGGLRALLLQSLHPLAMAAVAAHSGYRGDPWGRLQRTAAFIAVTTFGTATDAEAAIERIRAVHDRVHGTSPDGRPYRANDPHLLAWVHVAEVDSFLRCYQRYAPRTEAELAERLAAYRPELRGTPEARAAARFMLMTPPLPVVARPPYAVLAAAAVALLPAWARWPLRLPYLPLTEATTVRLAGHGLVSGLRWVMSPRQTTARPVRREQPNA